MRLLVDSLVALMLAAVLAAVVMHNRQRDADDAALEESRMALRELKQQVTLQVALEQVELNEQGYPRTIDPAWFRLGLPQNMLLDLRRPWLEVAGPEQRDMTHPGDLVADDHEDAAFWYNPYKGVVRARVPGGISDASALDVYNRVNECSLDDLLSHGDI